MLAVYRAEITYLTIIKRQLKIIMTIKHSWTPTNPSVSTKLPTGFDSRFLSTEYRYVLMFPLLFERDTTLSKKTTSTRIFGTSAFSFIHQWLYSPFVGPWRLLQFHDHFYTDSRNPWTSDQPVARPLPTHRTARTQNKSTHKHPCLEWDSNSRSQRPSERRQFMP
jgi:hypothetical protein